MAVNHTRNKKYANALFIIELSALNQNNRQRIWRGNAQRTNEREKKKITEKEKKKNERKKEIHPDSGISS